MAQGIAADPTQNTGRAPYSRRDLFRYDRLNIGARLTLCFTAIVLLMTAGDAIAVWQFERIQARTARFYQADQESFAVLRVHLDVIAFRDRLAALASTQDARQFAVDAVSLRKSFLDDVERAKQSLSVPSGIERDPAILNNLEAVEGALPAQIDSLEELAEAGDWQAVRSRLAEPVEVLVGLSSSLVERVIQQVAAERVQALQSTQRTLRQLLFVLPVTALLTVLMAVWLGWQTTSSITVPLTRLDTGAQALARGDFHHHLDVVGEHELARLARAFNDAAHRLSGLYDSLRSSESRFRSLIEHSSDLILTLDGDGTIRYASPSSQRVVGLKPEELLGKRLSEFLPLADTARMRDGSMTPALGMRPIRVVGFRHAGGNLVVLEVAANNLLDEPAVAGIVVNARDVTERVRAEEALRHSEEKYRAFFEQNLAGNYISNPDGTLLDCNPAWLRMFGFASQEEARQTNFAYLRRSPDAREKFLQQLKQRGRLEYYEQEYRRKDGSSLYATENALAVFDQQGELVEIHGFLIDDTERRNAEIQLRNAQKMEAVGQLAGGVAHDFNNLLGVIMGTTEMLLEGPGCGEPLRRRLENIQEAGRRAAALTRQLLAFSRKQTLVPAVLDLNRIVEETGTMMRRLIGEDIDLHTVLASDLASVRADPVQMEQVVLNLCVNARDAMPKGGRITIATSNREVNDSIARQHPPMTPGPYVRLTVSDTGIGMDQATLARIFEPFFTTKGPEKGTGLGLATVYGIVRQSGGYIWAYSEPGQGTTLSIYLPAADEVDTNVEKPESKPPEMAHRGETVLLVEDALGLRELVHEILEGYGYKVLSAPGAAEAIQAAEHHQGVIQLLLTDVVMPQMSGPALAEHLLTRRPEMKVLYMSGYTDDMIFHHGVARPAVDLLDKPFSQHALAKKIREVLDRPKI